MTDDDRYEELRIAYHEAAHAVVSMIFGWPTEHVEVSEGGGGFHRPGITGIPMGGTREYAIVLLAGRLGETSITGEERVADDEWLTSLLGELRGDGHGRRNANHDDFKVLQILVEGDPEGTDSDHIESYRAWEDEARSLVADPDVRRKIETLAETLFRRRTMGDDALEIIEELDNEDANPGERWK